MSRPQKTLSMMTSELMFGLTVSDAKFEHHGQRFKGFLVESPTIGYSRHWAIENRNFTTYGESAFDQQQYAARASDATQMWGIAIVANVAAISERASIATAEDRELNLAVLAECLVFLERTVPTSLGGPFAAAMVSYAAREASGIRAKFARDADVNGLSSLVASLPSRPA